MFDPVDFAKREIVPLLEQLCQATEAADAPDQHAFFARILASLRQARDAEDLAPPFMDLSTSAFLGFSYAPGTVWLLDEVLEKAQRLSESLSIEPDDVH
jgi:hypothetical protein